MLPRWHAHWRRPASDPRRSSRAPHCARATAADFGAEFGVDIELDAELYGASAHTVLAKAAARGVADVLIVAHDPGLSVLAERLSDGGIAHMPTCAVASFAWQEDDWDVASSLTPATWSFDSPR